MKLNEKTIKGFIKKIEFHKIEIAKHRNALRELQDEIETCCDSFDRGIESLECAIDDLS